uniref:tyrosine-protein phosphatase non-receptor type substrate 1-like n=1 Tax=Euleptes europaea TaxID=460621 RepID=UPI0025418EAF|nr:tyrosine-protein phosphatase non-receptor type substrate 1-like [Euleptes europaea]
MGSPMLVGHQRGKNWTKHQGPDGATITASRAQGNMEPFNPATPEKWASYAMRMRYHMVANDLTSLARRGEFQERRQAPGETVAEYIAVLRQAAKYCAFPDVKDRLRDQLVIGLSDKKVLRRLLSKKSVTFEEALEDATQAEAAARVSGASDLEGATYGTGSTRDTTQVHYENDNPMCLPWPRWAETSVKLFCGVRSEVIMEAWSAHPRCFLTCLIVLLLSRWMAGARADELVVLQTQGPLRLTAGETLTLNCTLTGFGPPGGVRWYKGLDRGQPPVYNDKGAPLPRVVRIVPQSNTDYSIRISNIQPKDAGTYYCVKYKAATQETEYKLGKGTEVSVIATPSWPSITGPPGRVDPGSSVTFSCSSEGFFPRDITLTWLKDRRSISAPKTVILPPKESTSYRVLSTLEVSLTERDVKSELTCQIQHSTLSDSLRQSFKLGDALQVAPKISVEPGHLIEALVNQVVTITCSAKGFYPNNTSLVWRENGSETDLAMAEPVAQDQDGTFSVKSSLEVNATEQRNHSVFSCYAVRSSQTSDPVNVTLKIHKEGTKHISSESGGNFFRPPLSYILVLICLLVVLLVAAVLYFVWAKQRKGKGSTSVRLNESEKISGGANQEPDPNNVTYADLNFDKPPKKSPRQVVEVSQKSEYASIQTAPLATHDENVTYADLDMVHLSKAPKRPAPQPEEASSEYASVQVQNK